MKFPAMGVLLDDSLHIYYTPSRHFIILYARDIASTLMSAALIIVITYTLTT